MTGQNAMAEVTAYVDPGVLANAAAAHIVMLAREAVEARGRFALALSGGSTPAATYRRLAADDLAGQVDWARVHVFWGDERCVPPDHPDSNARMARETLLGRVPIPVENVHRIPAELEPARAAEACERALRDFFGETPRFDLVLLGLGDDGHTASLFPGAAAIHERERWALAVYVEKLGAWRVTLTPPVLNAARQVTFLVAGAGKAARLREVLIGPYQPDTLPAQIVRPADGRVLWLVDRAAAAELPEENFSQIP